MQFVYGLISDNGDGSGSMWWFKDEKLVDWLLDRDEEQWYQNEGSPAETLKFPDGFDIDSVGFSFTTVEEIAAMYDIDVSEILGEKQ